MLNVISTRRAPKHLVRLVLMLALLLASGNALANTLTQNTSWTIDRAGPTAKYRVVAYGDSIFAGYYGSLSNAIKRAGPYVQGEYLAKSWNTDIDVIRRTKSGAKADDIYNNKIVGERSYMQTTDTRVVVFEMCGNDFLQARSAFNDQTGTCSYAPIDTALSDCTQYQQLAMQAINQYANAGTKKKMIMNIYYPGYNADNVLSNCTDSTAGTKINKRDKIFPYLARSNWRACNFAQQYGFDCIDAFAQTMGADYDSNGDGKIDSDGLKWIAGETEAAYVTRITSTLKSTVRDSNTHYVTTSTSYDYLQSDDTHPTYIGGTIYLGVFGGTGSGTGAPDYTDVQIVNGKNPVWNQYGHERQGWAHSLLNPATP